MEENYFADKKTGHHVDNDQRVSFNPFHVWELRNFEYDSGVVQCYIAIIAQWYPELDSHKVEDWQPQEPTTY